MNHYHNSLTDSDSHPPCKASSLGILLCLACRTLIIRVCFFVEFLSITWNLVTGWVPGSSANVFVVSDGQLSATSSING